MRRRLIVVLSCLCLSSVTTCRSRTVKPQSETVSVAMAPAPSMPAGPDGPHAASPTAGAEALRVFGLDRTTPLRARPGDTVELLKAIPIAELPDDDPLQHLDEFRFAWRQQEGSPMELPNPTSARGAFRVPASARDGLLVFAVTIGRGAATTSGKVKVEVRGAR